MVSTLSMVSNQIITGPFLMYFTVCKAGYDRGSPPHPAPPNPPRPCRECEVGKVKDVDSNDPCGECGGGRTTIIAGASNSSSDCGMY